MKTIALPKQAFLGMVEGFLNQTGFKLYLMVVKLPEKKVLSCKQEGCGKPFDAHPPNETHTVPLLEEKPNTILRSYQCPDKHVNKIWWTKEADPIAKFTNM